MGLDALVILVISIILVLATGFVASRFINEVSKIYSTKLEKKITEGKLRAENYVSSSKEASEDIGLALFEKGLRLRYRGDFLEAEKYLFEARNKFNELNQGHSFFSLRISDVYVVLGDIRIELGQSKEAEKFYELAEEVLPRLTHSTDPDTIHRYAQARWAKSRLYIESQPSKAEGLLSNSLELIDGIARELQTNTEQYRIATFGKAVVCRLLGEVSLSRGDYMEAETRYVDSLVYAQQAKHQISEAHAYVGLSFANLRQERGNQKVFEHATDALTISESQAFFETWAKAEYLIGKAFILEQKQQEAATFYARSLGTAAKYSSKLFDEIADLVSEELVSSPGDGGFQNAVTDHVKDLWSRDKELQSEYSDFHALVTAQLNNSRVRQSK